MSESLSNMEPDTMCYVTDNDNAINYNTISSNVVPDNMRGKVM